MGKQNTLDYDANGDIIPVYREDMEWNLFDFILVAACWATDMMNTGVNLSVLRLLRLVKLIRAIPELKVIMGGLANGMGSIFYILILLVLIFYVYAILGIFTL